MAKAPTPQQERKNRWPRQETREILSFNLKRLRAYRGISQETLAERSGLHRDYIGALERCIKNPTFGTFEAVADGLDVHIGELFLAVPTPQARQLPESSEVAATAGHLPAETMKSTALMID